ncbi:hypothetical protein NZD89_05360 [Alicyclobacillus fastidiosus]|uniref:Uncharacterized protein n=1 Tax=Alicyclobacillus fastidiosus TaxID=392011 RepID=A0ABY6ZJT4_9BACL|nr:hypothetical protein [Alicyclobacillus fastidiosus]WAH42858.1 hypothetical protein NZD89_05360 [Alicyclobacillus fastidiosus]
MDTSERVGYRDAVRQVHRAFEHRIHHLQEALKVASGDKAIEIKHRIDEIEHLMEIVDSLHR